MNFPKINFRNIGVGLLTVIIMLLLIPLGIGVLGLMGNFNNNDIFVTVGGVFGTLAAMSSLAFSAAQTLEERQKSSMNEIAMHFLRGTFFSFLVLASQAVLKMAKISESTPQNWSMEFNAMLYPAFSGVFLIICFATSFFGIKELVNHLSMSTDEWAKFDEKRRLAAAKKRNIRNPQTLIQPNLTQDDF
ncbi:MAG: hypothetical protein RLZZ156_2456 [Deinococcota bacterium]|jgi:hypothetical protein